MAWRPLAPWLPPKAQMPAATREITGGIDRDWVASSDVVWVQGSFAYLDEVRTMFEVHVIALISYDQTQFTDEEFASITYRTLIGRMSNPFFAGFARSVETARGDRMRTLRLALFVCLLISPVLSASRQTRITDPGVRQICAEVKDVELPAQDRPSPEERSALVHCISQDLYFGFGQPADPAKARKCAYVETEEGNKDLPFGGKTILMMVYVNGKGAPRNLDVALRLACDLSGAPSDVAGNIHQLARFKEAHWTGENFSVCHVGLLPALDRSLQSTNLVIFVGIVVARKEP
jgi:hypothetical protein